MGKSPRIFTGQKLLLPVGPLEEDLHAHFLRKKLLGVHISETPLPLKHPREDT